MEVLYTIKHKIGITIGGHLPFIQDLYQYAQEAFRVPQQDHSRLMEQATKEKVGHLSFNNNMPKVSFTISE